MLDLLLWYHSLSMNQIMLINTWIDQSKYVKICGVDDAGRGSVLGPLVIAGVAMNKRKTYMLKKIGVCDSKQLSPQRRDKLYSEIIDLVDAYHIVKIQPRSIDASVRDHKLNFLEAKYMARVVQHLAADRSYVDSCDVNTTRFGKVISEMSGNHTVCSYHHADSRFVIVSAASILAKVTRDRAIAKLRQHNNLGSGYPADPKTKKFLVTYYTKNKTFPTFVRKSWMPVKTLIQTLGDDHYMAPIIRV